jgi:hypothetical protein
MNRLARVLLLAGVAAPSPVFAQAPAPSRFVVRRGADTVATEEFTRSATLLKGTVASSNGARTNYAATLRPDGSVQRLEAARSGREPLPATVTTSIDFADTVAKISVAVGEQSQASEIVSGFKYSLT